MNRVEIREEAERDIFDAALWYEQERAGFGFRFENEVGQILERLIDNPLQFPVMERGVRRAPMGIFPYAVFFRFEDSVVSVLAVLHLHRHPKTWKR
jgi:plasmid stabilization system protein ParE